MTVPGRLLERARARGGRLIIAGTREEAVAGAAQAAAGAGLAAAIVIGPGGLAPEEHPRHADVAALLRSHASDRVRDAIHALDLATDPLRFAAGLLALGEGTALLAPGAAPLPDLADAARWALGNHDRVILPAAAACLLTPDGRLALAADCGLPAQRGPDALAWIGQSLAGLRARLADDASVVAFLAGPAPLESDSPVRSAREAFAMIGRAVAVAAEGAPGSEVDSPFRGRANVLIFPDSTAGHLTVRALRAYGGVGLVGPLIVGVARPVLATPGDATEAELAGAAAVAVLLADSPGR